MIEQSFNRCISELKSDSFNRLTFLKAAAELAPKEQARLGLLVIYSFYHFIYKQNYSRSLQCIEQAMNLKPDNVTVSILFTIKGGVLTYLDKHSQALHLLKEALSISSNSVFNKSKNYIRGIFPHIIAKVINACNTNRGRRQFLTFLEKVRMLACSCNEMRQVEQVAHQKTIQIRELMRFSGKNQYQNHSQSHNQLAFSKSRQTPHTSIYISRLYQERKYALGQRQISNKKSTPSDPYQLSLQERERSRGPCQYM